MTTFLDRAVVVGGRGFIGKALVAYLRAAGSEVIVPEYGDHPSDFRGHVFFCAGLTSDFRTRLNDTMATHVTLAQSWLALSQSDTFTYLSSTRVYADQASGDETASISVNPASYSDFYNISKLAGEALVLTDKRHTARVVRLSNIFDRSDTSANFLTSIVNDAANMARVAIGTTANSAKDYLPLHNAVEAIARMPVMAKSRLINVASGTAIDNATIGAVLAELTGAEVSYGTSQGLAFPPINVGRMRDELGIEAESFYEAFSRMVKGPEK